MKSNRREFFKYGLTAIAAIPAIKVGSAFGAYKCPSVTKIDDAKVVKKLIDPTGKTAKRLKFVMNAPDAKDHKKYKAGNLCGNCKFYKVKKEAQDHAPCSMAGNKYVPACGWCKSYKIDKKKM
ncbi:MAG: high-potential iron-sulfur protein [Bacteriovoracaceae bacterium]|nr:high-potential iron-sulfur protein [Bacteriovoracaceae bacterium]